MGTLWAKNFEDWLSTSQGVLFYLLVFGLILPILVNLVAVSRRPEERDRVRTGFGRMLTVVGGFITLIAQVMPWENSFLPTLQTYEAEMADALDRLGWVRHPGWASRNPTLEDRAG